MITAVGHEKGGTGKTTLSTNLAVWLQERGASVVLIDADRQGNAIGWAKRRIADGRVGGIHCVQATGEKVADTAEELSEKYEHVVIDCRGTDGEELRSAILVADELLIPVRTSIFDLEVLGRLEALVEVARELGNERLRARVILNMVSTNLRVTEANEARADVLSYPGLELAQTYLHDRKAFRDGGRGGWSVLEMDDKKALQELDRLGEEIYGRTQQKAALAV